MNYLYGGNLTVLFTTLALLTARVRREKSAANVVHDDLITRGVRRYCWGNAAAERLWDVQSESPGPSFSVLLAIPVKKLRDKTNG